MSEPQTVQGVTARTVRSSAWMYGRMLVTNVINLGVMAILARQLAPADFGLVALAQVLLRFLAVVGSSGVGEYVIYDNAPGREERTHAAFWVGMSMALVVVVLGLLATPFLIKFYTDPGLDKLLLLMIIRYPLQQFSTVPDALIKKTLDYQKLVIRDTILEILTSLGSVAMALTGFGVYSLVIPGLIAAPLRALIVMWMGHWYPSFPLRIKLWKKIFKYSVNVIGANLATTISAEGDTLIIGKTLGSTQLGLYNLAWQSANLVSRTVTGVIGKLAMPAFSAVSDDPERLRTAYKKVIRTLGFVSFPLLIGLFVIADLFILTIYGPQWKESILPLQILIVFALRHTVGSPVSTVPYVVGRPDLAMKYSLAFIPFYLTSIWIGSRFGIIGIAIAVTCARTIFGIVQFWLSANLIHGKLVDVFKATMDPFIAALLMGFIVWVAKKGIESFVESQLLVLGMLLAIGGIAYLLILRIFYSRNLRELITLIESIFPKGAKFFLKICYL